MHKRYESLNVASFVLSPPSRFEQSHAKWRTNRRLLVQHFTTVASQHTKEAFVPIIEAESTQLLHDFLHKPGQFMSHPVRFSSSVMTSISEHSLSRTMLILQPAVIAYAPAVWSLQFMVSEGLPMNLLPCMGSRIS